MVGMAGRLPKWPTGADCKSAGLRLRWFESITYHHFLNPGIHGALPNWEKLLQHKAEIGPLVRSRCYGQLCRRSFLLDREHHLTPTLSPTSWRRGEMNSRGLSQVLLDDLDLFKRATGVSALRSMRFSAWRCGRFMPHDCQPRNSELLCLSQLSIESRAPEQLIPTLKHPICTNSLCEI